MAVIEVRTVKTCDLWDASYVWDNRYYMDVPSLEVYWLINFFNAFTEVERGLHYNVVRYKAVIAVNHPLRQAISDTVPTYWPVHEGNLRGWWPLNGQLLDQKYILRVSRYVDTGKNTNWYYRGCLCTGDVELGEDNKTWLTRTAHFNAIIENWLNHFKNGFGVQLLSGYACDATGVPTILKPIDRIQVNGASRLNATTRSKSKITHNGLEIERTLSDNVTIYRTVENEIAGYLFTSGDNIPANRFKELCVNVLTQQKLIAQQVRQFWENPGENGQQGSPRVARWSPTADDIIADATSVIDTVADRIQQVEQVPTHGVDPNNPLLMNEDAWDIWRLAQEYQRNLGRWRLADWETRSVSAT